MLPYTACTCTGGIAGAFRRSINKPTMENEITLSGFGDFSEDEGMLETLTTVARAHGVELYPTYYDYELKGDAAAIEAITMEAWSMPRDQWSENGLIENSITE